MIAYSKSRKLKRREWLERQHARNPRCHYCQNLTELPPYGLRREHSMLYATLDHAHPRAHGGNDDARNFRLACVTCNTLKGTMSEKEYIAELEEEGIREKRKRRVPRTRKGRLCHVK